ncbi:MAG TPA: flagellar FliJ family protein [Acidimicrobiales bacterium]|nr:flagellar FliJ family protein [Acidimicrobiales bacterium]
MRAFRFRLESVARVREHQQRAAAQRLAVAARDLRLAQRRREAARQATIRLAYPDGPGDAAALHWVHEQSDRMATIVALREERVTAAEAGVHTARQSFLEAERRRTALHRLEARQRDRWQREADRAWASELDDMATVRFSAPGGAS